MSLEDVKQSLNEFLKSKNSKVIALSGKWGRGKTHFWNELVIDYADEIHGNPKYSYVSLFGVTSLAELKDGIFENCVPNAKCFNAPTLETLYQNTHNIKVENFGSKNKGDICNHPFKWLKTLFWKARKNISVFQKIPAINKFGPFIKSAAFLGVRDYLICFDDLERRGEKLDIKDVMGLVSMLNEQRNCKIILILNHEGLHDDSKTIFDSLREKILDFEIAFVPDPIERAKLIFTDEDELSLYAVELINKLKISNIRVIKRIKRTIDDHLTYLSDLDIDIKKSIIHTSVLLTWCYNSKNEENVPDYMVIKTSSYGGPLFSEDTSKKVQEFKDLLWDYGYSHTNDLGKQICNYLENGFINSKELQHHIQSESNALDDSRLDNEFHAAWDIYHSNFKENTTEFLEKIYSSFIAGASKISYTNANDTIHILMELNEKKLASELTEHWIKVKLEKNPEALDPTNSHFPVDIHEPLFIDPVSKALNELKDYSKPNLETLVQRLTKQDSWNPADEVVLSEATVEEYFNLFKSIDNDVNYSVRACIKVATHYDGKMKSDEKVVDKIKEALKRIGSESKLNNLRVKKYGIDSTNK